jgi:hypothetical protein
MRYNKQKIRAEKIRVQVEAIEEARNTECEGKYPHAFPNSKFTYEDMMKYGTLTTWCTRCQEGFSFTIKRGKEKKKAAVTKLKASKAIENAVIASAVDDEGFHDILAPQPKEPHISGEDPFV